MNWEIVGYTLAFGFAALVHASDREWITCCWIATAYVSSVGWVLS